MFHKVYLQSISHTHTHTHTQTYTHTHTHTPSAFQNVIQSTELEQTVYFEAYTVTYMPLRKKNIHIR